MTQNVKDEAIKSISLDYLVNARIERAKAHAAQQGTKLASIRELRKKIEADVQALPPTQ